MDELNELSGAVVGAAIEVHRQLGPGYLESVYEDALALELVLRGVPFGRQVAFSVRYKGHPVGRGRIDFLVGDILVVELKAVRELAPIHKSQVLSYLRAVQSPLGLLLNFNVSVMTAGVRRVALTR